MAPPSVGEQLKRARSELRLSLKDATQATKIPSWALESLERDQLQATMSPVYIKGFLTTYAKFLGLDPVPLIAQLFPPPPPAPSDAVSVSPPSQGVWTSVMEAAWPLLRRGGVAAVGVALVGWLLSVHPLRWISTNVLSKEASLAVSHTPSRPPPVEAVERLEATHPLELAIVAHRPTWVSVKADGALVAQQQLAAGSQETWKARRRFEVVVGTPAKADVLLNGQPIGPLVVAHRGRLLITHRGIKPLDE